MLMAEVKQHFTALLKLITVCRQPPPPTIACSWGVKALRAILLHAFWHMPLDFHRKLMLKLDSAEMIDLVTRTVNISVGKCVAQWPGRAIGDAF